MYQVIYHVFYPHFSVILQGFLGVQIPRDPGMRAEMNIHSLYMHILGIFTWFLNQGHMGISACRVKMEGRINWGGRFVYFGKTSIVILMFSPQSSL